MHLSDTALMEDTATQAVWVEFRKAVRQSVREKPVAVTVANVRALGDALNDQTLKDVVTEVMEKPSESDIEKAISIIRSELGLTEGIIDNLEVVWVALKAAYATGRLAFFGKLTLEGMNLAKGQAVAILLGVAAALVSTAVLGVAFRGFYWLTNWVVSAVYRRWKLVKLPLFRVPLSSELRQIGCADMILRLKEGDEYRFFIPVMSWDAYHVTKQPVEIRSQIPFEFHGFVSPRWFEDTFMWLTPSAGRIDDEERLVELKHVVDIQNLDGVPIYSEEFDVQV
jgi:hypothetical protein